MFFCPFKNLSTKRLWITTSKYPTSTRWWVNSPPPKHSARCHCSSAFWSAVDSCCPRRRNRSQSALYVTLFSLFRPKYCTLIPSRFHQYILCWFFMRNFLTTKAEQSPLTIYRLFFSVFQLDSKYSEISAAQFLPPLSQSDVIHFCELLAALGIFSLKLKKDNFRSSVVSDSISM